jgi:SAM-dependent methyltransferase
MQLNDPALVRAQYADEHGLAARKANYAGAEGPDARELAFRAVAEHAPSRVLEVGGGEGELAERIMRELDAEVIMLDQSERMVELACGRGVDARVGDAQSLRFENESFDCAVAAWMLYHVADIPLALSELARILRPGGRLVAVTNGADHLVELRELAGHDGWWTGMAFSRENGEELLRASFARVEARDADGWVSIPDDDTIWSYLRSMSSVRPPIELPPHDLPFRVRRRPTVFVADK